mgnify:FL=1
MGRALTYILTGAFLTLGVGSFSCVAAQAEPIDLFELSLKELMHIPVVTARKRAENLQDIPVSVSVYSAHELAALQVTNISQISNSTPNLVFDDTAPISGSSSAASIFIRGVGQTDFTLVTDPGVGLYLDEVYIARSVGAVLELLDVERVEVLRGPQGTLFGKNTIGGAINITSKRPSNELSGEVELKTGTDNRADVKTALNLPLADAWLMRMSYANLNQDGYVKNLGAGPNLNDTDAQLGRMVVSYDSSDKFMARFSTQVMRRREQGRAQKLVRFNPAAPGPTFGPFSALGVGTFDEQFLSGGEFATHQGEQDFVKSDLDVYGTSLVMNYQFTHFNIKSITAHRELESEFGRDSDNSTFNIIQTQDVMDHEQLSQELQVSNGAGQNKWQWLLGLYYFQEKGNNLNVVSLPVFDVVSGGGIENESMALFGQASIELTDKMTMTMGGRYTDETKRFLPDQVVSFNENTVPVYGGAGFVDGQRILPKEEFSQDFDNFSGLLSMDYRWNQRLLTYLSYSEGYKSGGFNQRVFPPRTEPGSFKPEDVAVYEFGWKTSNDTNTLRLNGALFYTDYSNVQVKVIDVVAPGTGNAAEGRVYGGELELTALLNPDLSLFMSAGYLDTKYNSFAEDFDPDQGIDKGSRFVNAPQWSLYSGVSYVVQVANYGDMTWRADWRYRSKVYNDAANSEFIAQDDFHLFNAGATFKKYGGQWQLAMQVRNITDETYVVTGNDEYSGFGYTELVYARPREWSLTVKRLF